MMLKHLGLILSFIVVPSLFGQYRGGYRGGGGYSRGIAAPSRSAITPFNRGIVQPLAPLPQNIGPGRFGGGRPFPLPRPIPPIGRGRGRYPGYPYRYPSLFGAVYPFGFANYIGTSFNTNEPAFDFQPMTPSQAEINAKADNMALSTELDSVKRQLTDLQRMQEEATSQRPAASAIPQNAPPVPSTVLVFKDGRRREMSSFAVMDKVLWDFSSGVGRKIALNDVDIAASKDANADRGTDFPANLAQ